MAVAAAAVQATLVFILESAIFALIRLKLPDLVRRLTTAGRPWLLDAVAVTVVLMAIRIAWVFALAGWLRWRMAWGPSRCLICGVARWSLTRS